MKQQTVGYVMLACGIGAFLGLVAACRAETSTNKPLPCGPGQTSTACPSGAAFTNATVDLSKQLSFSTISQMPIIPPVVTISGKDGSTLASFGPKGTITTKQFSVTMPMVGKEWYALDWPKSLTAEGSWTFKIDGKEYKLTGQQLADLITGKPRIVQHSTGRCSPNIASVKGNVNVAYSGDCQPDKDESGAK